MRFVLALSFCSFSFAAATSPAVNRLLGSVPLRFEPNSGLRPSAETWVSRGQGYSFGFTDRGTVLHVGNRTLRLSFPGAKNARQFSGENRQLASTNYFYSEKRISVPAYGRLREAGIYDGIDAVFYGNGIPGVFGGFAIGDDPVGAYYTVGFRFKF